MVHINLYLWKPTRSQFSLCPELTTESYARLRFDDTDSFFSNHFILYFLSSCACVCTCDTRRWCVCTRLMAGASSQVQHALPSARLLPRLGRKPNLEHLLLCGAGVSGLRRSGHRTQVSRMLEKTWEVLLIRAESCSADWLSWVCLETTNHYFMAESICKISRHIFLIKYLLATSCVAHNFYSVPCVSCHRNVSMSVCDAVSVYPP